MGFWFDHTLVFFDKKITFLVNVFLIRICFTKRRETFLKKATAEFLFRTIPDLFLENAI